MEFSRSAIKAKIYGKEYELVKPSVSVVQEFGKTANQDEDPAKAFGVVADFLSQCGLPKDVTMDMEPGHVNQLIDLLIDKQKK
ncbi:MAG: hypothetical protein HRT70_01270 [Flavobacteriaceae bacterium]|nr:hypothetical protein [Flavobacteriaceae bacterium]